MDIDGEIKALENCMNCCKEDGCYVCRKRKPDMQAITKMLKELKRMREDE